MNLAKLIQFKYPDADLRTDVIIMDEGAGAYIKEWNLEGIPEPTQKDLVLWEQEVQPLYDAEQKALTNAPILAALQELDLKSIRALREEDQERINSYEAEAVALRQELV